MTNLEWIRTLSAEELADWFYGEWLDHMQYRWSSSKGGLKIWLADRKTEPQTERDCETCDHQYSGNGCWNCLSNVENNYKPQMERSE